jgi:hypothetical protein
MLSGPSGLILLISCRCYPSSGFLALIGGLNAKLATVFELLFLYILSLNPNLAGSYKFIFLFLSY